MYLYICTIINLKNKKMKSFRYIFKNKKTHADFKTFSIKQGKTMQDLIHEALTDKYSNIFKKQKTIN